MSLFFLPCTPTPWLSSFSSCFSSPSLDFIHTDLLAVLLEYWACSHFRALGQMSFLYLEHCIARYLHDRFLYAYILVLQGYSQGSLRWPPYLKLQPVLPFLILPNTLILLLCLSFPEHFLIYYIICLFIFIACFLSPLLECNFHEGRDRCLYCSLKFPKLLEWILVDAQ